MTEKASREEASRKGASAKAATDSSRPSLGSSPRVVLATAALSARVLQAADALMQLRYQFDPKHENNSLKKHGEGKAKDSNKGVRTVFAPLRQSRPTISGPPAFATATSRSSQRPHVRELLANNQPNSLTRTALSHRKGHHVSREMNPFDPMDGASSPVESQQAMATPEGHSSFQRIMGEYSEYMPPFLDTPAQHGAAMMQYLHNEMQWLRSIITVQDQELSRLRVVATELAGFNENIYRYLSSLHERMQVLEGDNARLRAPVEEGLHQYRRSRSVSRGGTGAAYRDDVDGRSRSPSLEYNVRSIRNRNSPMDVDVKEEESPSSMADASLSTPTNKNGSSAATSARVRQPKQPTQEIARVSRGGRKAQTLMPKRNVHTLGKTMPPATTQFPLVPITDVELIVYFFNSLARPICALRLYARGQGPASITTTLNYHRDLNPPYLRNTCSVKCVTAIRRGKEQYGDDWEDKGRAAFLDATDDKATEMIRLTDKECKEQLDIDVLELLNGLKKYPQGRNAGIFTRCVQYCEKHNLSYPLSEINKLAAQLEQGLAPRAPDAQFDIGMNDSAGSVMKTEESVTDMAIRSGRTTSIDTSAETVIDDSFNAVVASTGKENEHPEVSSDDEEIDSDDEEVSSDGEVSSDDGEHN